MGFYRGPHLVTDGLTFAIDAGSTRSYAGSGTTAYNLVANNDVSLINGLGWQSGNGGYFSSDGTDDGMTTPDATNLDLVDFTLEGWVWWDQHKNYGSFLVKGPGGSGNLFNYSFFGYATTVSFGYGDGSNYRSTSISSPAINEWHHIMGTYDGSTLKFYLNSTLTSSTTTSATPNQNNDALQILQSQYSIDGRIGCARVYNRALTAAEVLQNYNAQKSRFGL